MDARLATTREPRRWNERRKTTGPGPDMEETGDRVRSRGRPDVPDGTWSDESEFTGWEDLRRRGRRRSPTGRVPVVAVVGRPNVGKSTLVNRLIGRREAVVQDIPGVTRDRVSYDAIWRGRRFTVVDTGGWEPEADAGCRPRSPPRRRRAMRPPTRLVVVDATVGATATDEAIAGCCAGPKRPVILVANKVDDERAAADAAALWSLGLGEPYRGVGAARSRLRRPAGRGAGRAADGAAASSRGRRRTAPGGAARQAQRRQVVAAEQADRREPVPWSTRSPGRRSTRSTRWSSSTARCGGSSTPPGCAGGCTRPRAWSTTRRCVRRRPWKPPRSPSCCVDSSEPLAEQDQRVIIDGRRRRPGAGHRAEQGRPGGRRPARATSSARWSATWTGSPGPSGSTSPR